MSATTSIAWTDKTWNPVRGCSVISPGCVNCYAMKQAHRFSGPGKPYEGLTKQTAAGPQWTGEVRCFTDVLEDPLHWRTPARVFVNSMSDLFHEDVPDQYIAAVFGVMAAAPRHTFQILTKRADRMRDWFRWLSRTADPDPHTECHAYALGEDRTGVIHRRSGNEDGRPWPLPNVWLGVSVEDQAHADERIPLLTETPAAVRFVSAEPLLGPVDFSSPVLEVDCSACIDWVIVGGESGPGARPCDLAWARSIVQQCEYAGVACFVKQIGAHAFDPDRDGYGPQYFTKDAKGADPSEWPADLRVQEFPHA